MLRIYKRIYKAEFSKKVKNIEEFKNMLRLYKAEFSKKVKNIEAWTKKSVYIGLSLVNNNFVVVFHHLTVQ